MGMFDTVNFRCPDCGELLEVQSKAGHCVLDNFSSCEVPVTIAHDIQGEHAYCDSCDESYKVGKSPLPRTVEMKLEKE